MTPRIGSLCSGYGGLEMGLMAVIGGSVAWHVEYDKHPAAVLEARFPGVPNYGDVTTTDWAQVEPVDWLTAGYPCQPFSHAGKRRGSNDERHLWPDVAHAIGVLRPRRILLENVAGHVSLGLDAVLADLAALGYDATWGVVRAADAGAPHGRARIFIVAVDTRHGAGSAQHRKQSALTSIGTGQPDPVFVADAATSGRGRPERVQRGLGTAERLAAAVADTRSEGRRVEGRAVSGGTASTGASDRPSGDDQGIVSDTNEQGRQGPEPTGRRLLSARGTVTDAEGSVEPSRSEGTHAAPLVGPGTGTGTRTGARRASTGAGVLVGSAGVEWGAYGPAIRRWEHVTGRAAPRPTEPGRTGERLSPRFVEWLMGLPAGHVTDVLPRSPALKCLGNGVAPQHAALAVRTLLAAADSEGQQVPA